MPGAVLPVETVRMEVTEPPGESVTVFRLNDSVGPTDDTAAVKFTEPAKPLIPDVVIADEPEEPAFMVNSAGSVERVKSTTFTVTVTEWERPSLTPVTVTVKAPVEGLVKTVRTETTDPPDARVTLVWLRDTPRPVGETAIVRAILPVKPLRLVRATEDVPKEPA